MLFSGGKSTYIRVFYLPEPNRGRYLLMILTGSGSLPNGLFSNKKLVGPVLLMILTGSGSLPNGLFSNKKPAPPEPGAGRSRAAPGGAGSLLGSAENVLGRFLCPLGRVNHHLRVGLEFFAPTG